MMLDGKVLERINRLHEELTNRGELPTRAQLEQYYGTFRERFGPQRLASLDNEGMRGVAEDTQTCRARQGVALKRRAFLARYAHLPRWRDVILACSTS